MDEQTLRGLAEQLEAELPTLIPDATAREPLEQDLTEALGQPPGAAGQALQTALRSHPVARGWMRAHTTLTGDTDRVVGLLGGVLTGGMLFICVEGDYSVVRESVSSEILFCPNDGSILERYSS